MIQPPSEEQPPDRDDRVHIEQWEMRLRPANERLTAPDWLVQQIQQLQFAPAQLEQASPAGPKTFHRQLIGWLSAAAVIGLVIGGWKLLEAWNSEQADHLVQGAVSPLDSSPSANQTLPTPLGSTERPNNDADFEPAVVPRTGYLSVAHPVDEGDVPIYWVAKIGGNP